MEKLNFKKKICVFISGKGSNLQSLYKYSLFKKSNYKIHLVVSNKKKAKVNLQLEIRTQTIWKKTSHKIQKII